MIFKKLIMLQICINKDNLNSPLLNCYITKSNMSCCFLQACVLKQNQGPRSVKCSTCGESIKSLKDLRAHRLDQHMTGGASNTGEPTWLSQAPPSVNLAYNRHRYCILESHNTESNVIRVFNFPVEGDSHLQGDIEKHVQEIFSRQNVSFRLNFAFGMLLQNIETDEIRYYFPYRNTHIFQNPPMIRNYAEFESVLNKIRDLNVVESALKDRPDSKWKLVRITNIRYVVTLTDFPLGCTELVEAPSYLVKKKSVKLLLINENTRQPFNDNLCLFRCLATYKKLSEDYVHQYYREWRDLKNITGDFPGVTIEEIPELEKYFEINMHIFHLDETDHATTLYASTQSFKDDLYMNAWDNHLMLISNLEQFCNKYSCSNCSQLFNRIDNYQRHVATCKGGHTLLKFPGKYYKDDKTIFDKLEEFGIKIEDPYFEYFALYDYEAMLKPVQGDKKWTAEHEAISVSVCSNVPGFTSPKCFINSNLRKLIEMKISYLNEIQNAASAYTAIKWSVPSNELSCIIQRHEQLEYGMVESLEKLRSEFDRYITQLPVVGYNSSKYDLNLIKKSLADALDLDKEGYVIKKQNAYTSIGTSNFKFIDANNFVAPGTSYDKFLKSYHCSQQKSYFPYEWFDDESKLDEPKLPDYNAFYSKLKGKNISSEDSEEHGLEIYKQLQKIWIDNGMCTFRDWLIYYNNLDVKPFVEALSKMHSFYKAKRVDVFKQTISVPGIARILLFRAARTANASFPLFNKKNEDLYRTVKRNIVGGPSIIFQRHMKAGETKIRNGLKTCQSVVGYDCNALYLWALSQDMPVGAFIRRREETKFKAEKYEFYMMAFHWLDYVSETQNCKIDHYLNSGKETRVLGFQVDGFDSVSQTIYQFHGCYYHGHDCQQLNSERMKTRRENTEKITQIFKSSGYSVIEKYEWIFTMHISLSINQWTRIHHFLLLHK